MNHQTAQFLGIFPIGDANPLHLPVRELEQSLTYYEQALGFTRISRQDTPFKEARLQRDHITMGLAENGGNPEEHSCYIAVSTVDSLFQELQSKQLDVSPIRLEENDGQTHRVFFLRAPDGLCFCFGQRRTSAEDVR